MMEEVRGANRRRTLRSGCTCQGVGAQSGERHARLPSTKIRIRNVVVEMQEWEDRMSDSRAIKPDPWNPCETSVVFTPPCHLLLVFSPPTDDQRPDSRAVITSLVSVSRPTKPNSTHGF